MAIRVAINGYGRIGRMVLRALYESQPNLDRKRDMGVSPAQSPSMVIIW
jgi:glyceraldehyde 3-phosphate dehydrogenase